MSRPSQSRRGVHAAALLGAMFSLMACSDSTGPSAPPGATPVASVEIQASVTALFVGDSVRLSAVARASTGAVLVGRTVTWTSRDAQVATVAPDGLVRTHGPGTAELVATVEGKTAMRALAVGLRPVASVHLDADSLVLDEGGSGQLAVEMRASNGAVLEGRSVSWTSDDPTVAVVSPDGRVDAVGAGTTQITARSEGRSASARVRVRPTEPPPAPRWVIVRPGRMVIMVGSGLPAYADVIGATGSPVPGARIDAWRTEDPTIATVGITGIVRGIAPGTTRVWARSGGVEGYAAIEVRAMPYGPEQRFELRPYHAEEPEWEPGAPVDTVAWEDPVTGGTTQAELYVTSAILTLRPGDERYTQEFGAAAYALEGRAYLGATGWLEQGSMYYDYGGAGWVLRPDGAAGGSFLAQARPNAELLLRQRVRGGLERAYRYVYVSP